MLARAAGLDPEKVDATMIGINHLCWSVRHTYDGADLMGPISAAYERWRALGRPRHEGSRLLELAGTMRAVPSSYLVYYYFTQQVVAESRAKKTTRAEDILAAAPGYWEHYTEQADRDTPVLDPERSRGGIHELELAIDVIAALFNARDLVMPVNVTNAGALSDFPDDRVVEVPGRVRGGTITPLPQPPLPRAVVGLIAMLAEHQSLAAEAAWFGTRADAVRALAAHPWCTTLPLAERLYDEMAHAHRAYLPDRLLH
jgi:6-phospho-beta-glucosidase